MTRKSLKTPDPLFHMCGKGRHSPCSGSVANVLQVVKSWVGLQTLEHHRKWRIFSLNILAASRTCGDDIKQFSHDTVSKSVPSRSFMDEEDITVGSLDLAHLQKPL